MSHPARPPGPAAVLPRERVRHPLVLRRLRVLRRDRLSTPATAEPD